MLSKEATWLDEMTSLLNHGEMKRITPIVPLGSHLLLLYVKIRQLNEWRGLLTSKCGQEGQTSTSFRLQNPNSFTKQMIESRLKVFFQPLESLNLSFESFFDQLINFLIRRIPIVAATSLNRSFLSTGIMEMYRSLLVNVSRIFNVDSLAKSPFKFTDTNLFFSKWKETISSVFSLICDEIAKHLVESVCDLLAIFDGPMGIEFLSWIYSHVVPSLDFQNVESVSLIFAKEFHAKFSHTLRSFIKSDLVSIKAAPKSSGAGAVQYLYMSPSDCLTLFSWVSEYPQKILDSIHNHNYLKFGSLFQLLSEDDERVLISRYVSQSKQVIKQWLSNLINTEKHSFIARVDPPDCDRYGKYFLPTTGDLFLFIGQVCGSAYL